MTWASAPVQGRHMQSAAPRPWPSRSTVAAALILRRFLAVVVGLAHSDGRHVGPGSVVYPDACRRADRVPRRVSDRD